MRRRRWTGLDGLACGGRQGAPSARWVVPEATSGSSVYTSVTSKVLIDDARFE